MKPYKFDDILLPNGIDTENWSVVACDQFTSEPEYWEKVREKVVYPTSLDLFLPECYLNTGNVAERIGDISCNMQRYLSSGIFKEYDGSILMKRTTQYGNTHYGLIMSVRLDNYSYDPTSKSLIRASEGVVQERIPPRVKIRKSCALELPHIMLLVDDPDKTVIEPCIGTGKKVYSGKLNMDGGEIEGYQITDTKRIDDALSAILSASEKKFGEKILFLVGDGNHSLATAKACVSKDNPLSEYALVEVVNLYDEGIKFEPIHRVIYGVDNELFLSEIKKIGGGGEYTVYNGKTEDKIKLPSDPIKAIKAVENFAEDFLKHNGGKIDYIHGENSLKHVTSKTNGVGIVLKAIDKSSLFDYVVKYGVLPKKSFSMGEATEKRYYLEARRIK